MAVDVSVGPEAPVVRYRAALLVRDEAWPTAQEALTAIGLTLAELPAGPAHTPRFDVSQQRVVVVPVAPVELNGREMQVLRGMAQGKSNGDIGRGLYLSEDTIKTYSRRLFKKLGANDRAHAVAIGYRSGILR